MPWRRLRYRLRYTIAYDRLLPMKVIITLRAYA